MEDITLDFFGEKVSIIRPKDLSSLRKEISQKFCFNEKDASEILIYYQINDEKQYIKTDEDYSKFLKIRLSSIFLDIDKNSKLYLDYKKELEEENTQKLTKNSEIDELIKKKEEIEKKEEEYIKSFNEKLSIINRQLDILLVKKLDLVTNKKEKIKDFQNQKENMEKKIKELSEKENKQILKASPKNEIKEENKYRFNKVKEVLDNIIDKVKYVTNEYILKSFESSKEEKIDNIKNITKNAIKEINNISRLVISQTNMKEEIKEKKREKINLRGAPKLKISNYNEDLCENCEYKKKHKQDHITITINDKEGDEISYRGFQCKGCGSLIWE